VCWEVSFLTTVGLATQPENFPSESKR
jgi:hypothetical protein